MNNHARAFKKRFPRRRSPRSDLIVHASHWNPFSVLGIHEVGSGVAGKKLWVIRAFLPEARQARVIDLSRGEPGELVSMELNPSGRLLRGRVPRAELAAFPYRLPRWKTMKDMSGISSIRTPSGRSFPTSTSIYWPRGRTIATTNGWVPTSGRKTVFAGSTLPSGHRVPNVSAWLATSITGTAAAIHMWAIAARTGSVWELLHPRISVRARFTSTRSSRAASTAISFRSRTPWLRLGTTAQDGLGRVGRHPFFLERP